MPEVIVLHFLDQHFFALAVEGQVEQVRAVVQVVDQFLLGERDGNDGLLVAVDDAGNEPGVAQPLVRARARVRSADLAVTCAVCVAMVNLLLLDR